MNKNKKTKNVKMNKAIEYIQSTELTNNVDTPNAINNNANNSKKESNSFR